VSVTSDYRIEKVRCPVIIVLTDGRRIDGDIFLNPVSRFRPDPQDPVEFLNEADAYFALVPAGEPTVLVAKENATYVEAPLEFCDTSRDDAALGVRVEVTVIGHGGRTGYIFPETPAGRGRLLDYLNSYRTRFLPLFEQERLTLVNRYAIAFVRELP
jgi:hypothetical protein